MLHLHSIEQPIRAGQWEEMSKLCQETPIPIALDEELIGINHSERKRQLLDTIRPQYIILKPSLHGGLHGSEEWIKLAKERGIGSWHMPQGLGTGQLFTDNIPYPLAIQGDCLWFLPEQPEPDLLEIEN